MGGEEKRILYGRWLPGMWEAPTGELDRLVGELFTPDAIGHWGNGKEVHGPAGIAEQLRQAHLLFSEIRTTLDVGPIMDGDLLSARWTFNGTYTGGMPQADAPAGTKVHYQGSDTFRICNGRFCEYRPQGDDLSLMLQLGAVGSGFGHGAQ